MLQATTDQVYTSELLNAQLQELRDIHLPAVPDLIPDFYGGWLAGLILLLAIAALLLYGRRYYRPIRLTTLALRELEALYQQLGTTADQAQAILFAESCKKLLKRRARAAHPAHRPEMLVGLDWRTFLIRTGTGLPPPETLVDALYAADAVIAPDSIRDWTATWLRRQRHVR